MKLRTRIVGSGTWETLFDGSRGDTLPEFKPDCRSVTREEPLANKGAGGTSSSPLLQPLGNVTTNLALRDMNVQYSSAAEALRAAATNGKLKTARFHLEVTEGSAKWYVPNCTCSRSSPNVQGVAVTYELDIKGQDITFTSP